MNEFNKGINVPSKDIVYRQDVEDMLRDALPSRGMWGDAIKNAIGETVVGLMMDLEKLPSALPESKEIGYVYCSSALLKMWMDDVLTDGEYNRIMEKLNAMKGKENE